MLSITQLLLQLFKVVESTFQKNANPHKAPCEIFFEILKFLERSEIEKCQLVSRGWNERITGWNGGPMRFFFLFAYTPSPISLYLREEVFGFPMGHRKNTYISSKRDEQPARIGKDIRVHGLKNAVFDRIKLALDHKSLKMVKTLTDNGKSKLECNWLYLMTYMPGEFSYYEHVKVCMGFLSFTFLIVLGDEGSVAVCKSGQIAHFLKLPSNGTRLH